MSASAGELLFAHIVDRPDEDLDLATAALVVGEFQYPNLDVAKYQERIDEIAQQAAATCSDQSRDKLAAVRHVLFDELGYRGNREDYYNPTNSFLHEVIDRRLGIPISLSVLFVCVARRLDLTVDGLGFPGHFLCRYVDSDGLLVIDPFNGGIELPSDELRRRLRASAGPDAELTDQHLAPVTTRQILRRMLTNLALVYGRKEDHGRHLLVVERMLILDRGTNHMLIGLRDHLKQKIAEEA